MALIGITGGIGSGKSTVTRMLSEMGFPVIDSDQIAREVVCPGQPAYKAIRLAWGEQVIDRETGQLNRAALAQIVFKNESERRKLNAITHPAIYRGIFFRVLGLLMRHERLIFIDLPLLFESGYMLRFVSRIVVVACKRQAQIERLQARNNYTLEEAEERINAQMSIDEKKRRADYVIDNDGDLERTRKQVDDLVQILVQKRVYLRSRMVLWLTMLSTFSILGICMWKLWSYFR